MSADIGIGIIGCGHIAAVHLNALKKLKDTGLLGSARVAALCDRNRARAESFLVRGRGPEQQSGVGPEGDPMQAPPVWVSDFQEGPGPTVFDDPGELLSDPKTTAVLVLTAVASHHEIGLPALREGKHLLIEKPLAVSMKAARLLVDAARKARVTFGVAECVHYMPSVRMARWAVDAGHLGKPQISLSAAGAGYWAPDKIVAGTSWRHRKSLAAGGVAVDWMVHSFHQLRDIFGEIAEVAGMASVVEPVRTTRSAEGSTEETVTVETDDTLSLSLRYANGAVGSVFASWAGHGEPTDLPPTFYGSKGSIRGDCLTLDGQGTTSLAEFFRANADATLRERFFPRGITDHFALQMHDFLSSIREGRPMETSGVEGMRDLAACFATLESSLVGRTIRVADALSGRADRYERAINASNRI